MNRAESVRVARSLFQETGGGSTPTSALQLWFSLIDIRTAKSLNALWHSRLPKFRRPTCRLAYVAEFGGVYYATAILTNPIARMLPQMEWIELNRMAIAPDAPKNTASRMLSWMAKDIPKRLPEVERLISYQETEFHTGTIYRAAGWVAARADNGGEWNSVSKKRGKAERPGPKQRWEKCLGKLDQVDRTESARAKADLPVPRIQAGFVQCEED